MLVVAHAHRTEVEAMKARDRALARLSAVLSDMRGLGFRYPDELPEPEWRRYLRAQVSCGAAMGHAFAAADRHSKWYRAFRHARRRFDERRVSP